MQKFIPALLYFVTVHECGFLSVLTAVFCGYVLTAVIVNEPGPGPLLFPVWTPVQLNCTVKEGFMAHWNLSLPDRDAPILTNVLDMIDLLLMPCGINARNTRSPMSQLVFYGNNSISRATVNCFAVNSSSLEKTSGTPVVVIFYGSPPPPTNLTATATGLGSLNISWSLGFIQEVPVNFTLTAKDVNAAKAVISGIVDYHYIFTVESSSKCDEYSFQVEAIAANVNSSGPSEMIIRRIPSLPDIFQAANAMQYSLTRSADDAFKFEINFQSLVMMCPNEPVISYTVSVVQLGSFDDNKTVVTSNINATSVIILVPDSYFEFSITVANEFGNSTESVLMDIFTTDVQSAKICLVGGTTYSIQCSYVLGSNAQGCVYFIVSSTTVENVTGTIARNNPEGVTVELDGYDEVLVYDWESDNSTGTLPIKVRESEACPPITTSLPSITTGGLANGSGLSLANIIIIATVALFMVLILLLVLIAWIIKRQRKGDTYRPRDATEMATNGSEGAGKITQLETIREELASNNKESRRTEQGPNALNINNKKVHSTVPVSTTQTFLHDSVPVNDDPIYSSPLPITKVPPAQAVNTQAFLHKSGQVNLSGNEPIYSSPLPITKAPPVFGEEMEGYTPIVLAKAPSKRVKLRPKPAMLNRPDYLNKNVIASQEDNQYSAVSNVPKKGAVMWKKLARKYQAGDLVTHHEAQNRIFDVEPQSSHPSPKNYD